MAKLEDHVDLLLFTTSHRKMQKPPKKQCVIKKLMDGGSGLTFQLPKEHILPHLEYTWADLLTEEVVAAEAVIAEVTEATIEAMVVAAAEVMEVVDLLHLITEVAPDGTTVQDQDPIHLVVTERGQTRDVVEL